jgi:AraC-like DNA-binding protein
MSLMPIHFSLLEEQVVLNARRSDEASQQVFLVQLADICRIIDDMLVPFSSLTDPKLIEYCAAYRRLLKTRLGEIADTTIEADKWLLEGDAEKARSAFANLVRSSSSLYVRLEAAHQIFVLDRPTEGVDS